MISEKAEKRVQGKGYKKGERKQDEDEQNEKEEETTYMRKRYYLTPIPKRKIHRSTT
jgi:hypothetical protein